MPTAIMKRLWLVAGAGAIPILLTVAVLGGWQTPDDAEVSGAMDPLEQSQPIQFPHDTHAGQFLINCQYCHYCSHC